MNRFGLNILTLLLLTVPSLGTAGTSPNKTTSFLANVRFEQKIGDILPLGVGFNNEYGKFSSLDAYFDKLPVILVFSYYRCPNLCNLVLNGLVQALEKIPDKLGKDFRVLSISINPSEKASLALAKKQSYLARLGVRKNDSWHFFTGTEPNIRKLTDIAGFHYQLDPVSGEYSHPSGFLVLTPEGKISKYFFGIQFNPEELHQALLNAQSGRKGSWAEEILLYCFHYDPKQSRNGPFIIQMIRLISAVSAMGIVILLFYLSWKSGTSGRRVS